MSVPNACPACGARALLPDASSSALLAVCDVLVTKALEYMGTWIVRQERARFKIINADGRPWHEAHTLWPPSERTLDKALAHAWDVLPAMLDAHSPHPANHLTAEQVTGMLDAYVRDLVLTGTPHHIEDLAYRCRTRLGMVLPDTPLKARA